MKRRAPTPRGAVVKDRNGYYHDARTGEFVRGPGSHGVHPRKLGKFRFATILNPRARKKWTPDVKISKVKRRSS